MIAQFPAPLRGTVPARRADDEDESCRTDGDATLAEVLRAGGRAHIGPEPGGVADRPAFTDRCACAFGLPDFVGRDRHALADLPWAPPPGDAWSRSPDGRSTRQEYAGAQPNGWNIAREVSADAADHRHGTGTGTDLRILLALGGSS
ncbi:hypothetical protein [Streptomyces europaeiscabiei]|uniref:hypothetical protein n=1 Tax=Streptomyces europaeiscabiei TaxID=146819 RepID=UPI0038F7938E